MKSVLISIRPEWCEKIANGKKYIEVRKTKPKLETPFKVYIYCTVGGIKKMPMDYLAEPFERGKVIGEYVCDVIYMSFTGYRNGMPGYWDLLDGSCLTADELMDYGRWETLYGWHISNLVIYNEPKELSEFYKVCPSYGADFGVCWECENAVGEEFDCSVNGRIYLSRPPQSWCYVEEGADNG